jgi:hypothetical protein
VVASGEEAALVAAEADAARRDAVIYRLNRRCRHREQRWYAVPVESCSLK